MPGLVGATLVRRLAASGYRVRVLDNLSAGDAAHLSDVDTDLPTMRIEDGIPRLRWFAHNAT